MVALNDTQRNELLNAGSTDPTARLSLQVEPGTTHETFLWVDVVLTYEDSLGLRSYPIHSILVDQLQPNGTKIALASAERWLKTAQVELAAHVHNTFQTTCLPVNSPRFATAA